MTNLTEKEYWRALILYGLNTATYKMAFAKSLKYIVDADKNNVSMSELAEVFLSYT